MYQKIRNEKLNNNGEVVSPLFRFDLKSLVGDNRNIFVYILSILISKVGLTTGINPFGMAMFGAIGNMNIPLLIPCILISITNLIVFGPIAAVKFIISAIVYIALKAFVKTESNYIINSGKLMLATAAGEIIGLISKDILLYDSLLLVYSVIITAIFYIIFSEGLEILYNLKNIKITSSENLMAVGIIFALLITSFGNLGVLGITIRGVLSVLIVLVLGWKMKASIGAASGIAIAITLGLTGYGDVVTVATFGFCGLLAGIFSKFGKLGAILRFLNWKYCTSFLCKWFYRCNN